MGLGPVLNFWQSRTGKPVPAIRDWTQQELSQFYRVEWALSQAGISVETDRGLSDEGDPWFAFCRASDAEVVIHIAREGQTYLLAGFLSDRIQRGSNFDQLVERLLAEHPAKSMDKRGTGNVVMHPATLLALLVSIAFLQSNEGRAEALAEHADGAAAPRPAALPPAGLGGVSGPVLRPAAALSTSVLTLVATFELSQAMTILRVASLVNEAPAADQAAGSHFDASTGVTGNLGWTPSSKRGSVSDLAPVDQHQLVEAHVASSATMPAVPLPSTHSGVEKLLEIVAKLWTFPDTGVFTPNNLTVSAALAFFSGTAGGSDAISIAPRAHQQVRAQADLPAPADIAKHDGGVELPSSGSSLTITHTPASPTTTAQTVLKLSVGDQGDVLIKTTALPDSTKLYSVVSELVANAKNDLAFSLKASNRVEAEVRLPDGGIPADKVGADEALKAGGEVEKAPAGVDPSYTTVFADGKIKQAMHTVFNNLGEAAALKAVAAFKEDAPDFVIKMSGSDVIIYSVDAVANQSPSSALAVEIWQFKDGTSISLVGLSVDGHLPYSL